MFHPAFATTAATSPLKRKKTARFLLPPSSSRYHRSGKPEDLRCSFQSSGMFFIICAMDNPSGSAPATIASTMSGARLFKPSTCVTYGGFKPSFAARSVMFFAFQLHGHPDETVIQNFLPEIVGRIKVYAPIGNLLLCSWALG